jgi:hypothetical protein
MHPLPVIFGLGLLGLFGCSEKPANPPSQQSSVAARQAEITATSPEPEVAAGGEECVRGEPEALLAAGSEFTKNGTREALETVQVASGSGLAIRHYGCTAYALEFQFKWSQGQLPLAESLVQAQRTLEGLQFKDDYQPVIKSIIAALKSLPAYDEPLSLSETETLLASAPSPNELLLRYDIAL